MIENELNNDLCIDSENSVLGHIWDKEKDKFICVSMCIQYSHAPHLNHSIISARQGESSGRNNGNIQRDSTKFVFLKKMISIHFLGSVSSGYLEGLKPSFTRTW